MSGASSPRPRIAVCAFGDARVLPYTFASIEENILQPARVAGETRVFCHLHGRTWPESRGAAAREPIDRQAIELIAPDQVEVDEAFSPEVLGTAAILHAGGNAPGDDPALDELAHSLVSIRRTWGMSLAVQPNITVFVRLDQAYPDTIAGVLRLAGLRHGVFVPDWQDGCGRNDRFAICAGRLAARAWGMRVETAPGHAARADRVTPEGLLDDALTAAGTPVHRMALRASRVSAEGEVGREEFRPDRALARRQRRKALKAAIRTLCTGRSRAPEVGADAPGDRAAVGTAKG